MSTSSVIIIGAGPAGAAAAIRLRQRGVEGVVLVDTHDFPRDKACGSGLSPGTIDVLRELGVWEAISPEAYPIVGLHLVTPHGRHIDLPAGRYAAAVCLRRVFDRLLLDRAVALGATFVPHFQVTAPILAGGRWAGVQARDGRIMEAPLVLVANGAHSRLSAGPRRVTHAIVGRWEGVRLRPHWIEMVYDPELAPFYGWLFPESDRVANIGVCYAEEDRNARDVLRRFIERHYADRVRYATPLGPWRGHPIVWSETIGALSGPGHLVAGEAGRLTHPASGEGIYAALRSGIDAGNALADVLAGTAEAEAFAAYEARCRHTLSPAFHAGRAFLGLTTTPALEWLAALAARPIVGRAMVRVLAG